MMCFDGDTKGGKLLFFNISFLLSKPTVLLSHSLSCSSLLHSLSFSHSLTHSALSFSALVGRCRASMEQRVVSCSFSVSHSYSHNLSLALILSLHSSLPLALSHSLSLSLTPLCRCLYDTLNIGPLHYLLSASSRTHLHEENLNTIAMSACPPPAASRVTPAVPCSPPPELPKRSSRRSRPQRPALCRPFHYQRGAAHHLHSLRRPHAQRATNG